MLPSSRLLYMLLASALMLSGCSAVRSLLPADTSDRGGLLQNGGFEKDTGWQIAAPPNYSSYARIARDDKIRHRGRRSATVRLTRHPAAGAGAVLHAWTQQVGTFPADARVQFGGWVRLEPGASARFGLVCELSEPVNGRSFVRIEIDAPPADNAFHYVEKTFRLPPVASSLMCYAGTAKLGTVHYDDLFVRRR